MQLRKSTSSAVTHKGGGVLMREKLVLVGAHEGSVAAAGGMLVLF